MTAILKQFDAMRASGVLGQLIRFGIAGVISTLIYSAVYLPLAWWVFTGNLPTFGISQARPSLDDVYLAATGQTLMDAEMAAASSRDPKAERKQNMR